MDAGLVLFVGGLVAAGIVTGISNLRTRRAFREERDRSLGEARAEVQEQTSALAQRVLDLTDRLAVEPHDEAGRTFAEAATAYQHAQERAERAANLPELEQASDDLDHARWLLESTEAQLDGRALPHGPDEAEHACFFDPTHGAGTEDAQVQTPSGTRTVQVCSYCATRLRGGVAVQPRMISVGGQRVPAAKAPRSYGGGGMEGLDDFQVVVDRMRVPYGWGGQGRRRRRW